MSAHKAPCDQQSKKDQQQSSRDAVLDGLLKKATDKSATWPRLSGGDPKPPCMQPLAELKVVRLSDLNLRGANPGALLVVRTIGQARQPGPLLPVLNVVEDDAGKYMHVEVYFPSTTPPTAILDSGNILAIKAPDCEVTSHGAVIRVVHPSDILILKPSHTLVPEAFLDLSGLSLKSVWGWRKKAKAALEKGKNTKAITGFSNALDQSSRAADGMHLSKLLHHRRSIATTYAGQHGLATLDALASASGRNDKQIEKYDTKLLRQTAYAAYQNQNFSLAHVQLQRLLALFPTDKQALIMSSKTQARIREEINGEYDFDSLKEQPVPLEVANFTRLTEIQASRGRGRGLFAKVNINRGDLVLCEKAFGTVYPIEVFGTNKSNAYSADDERARLWLDVVRKAFINPSQAQKLLALYGGPSYTSQSEVSCIDDQVVVDVYHVAEIIDFNCFGHYLPKAQQTPGTTSHSYKDESEATNLFIQASYANSSCVENTYISFVGDMIVLRAINDIPAGTELTVSYYPAHIRRPDRHSHILETWEFDCNCELCTAKMQCNADWDKIYKSAQNTWADKLYNDIDLIDRIDTRARRLESTLPDHLFKDLPRIATQYLQRKILDLWVDRKDNRKIRKHAVALLREQGFCIQASENDRKIQLYGPWGMLHKTVVDALYQLSRISNDEGDDDKADQYLALARTMHLTMNGTARDWEQKLVKWRGI